MNFIKSKLVTPFLNLLKQGLTPQKLALSAAMGIILGVFPMLGATTILCALFTWILRLNPVAIQVVNYFIYPLQILLYIPFFKWGAVVFGDGEFPYTVAQILEMLQSETWNTIGTLWSANVKAIMVWAVTVSPMGILIYLLLVPIFAKLARQNQILKPIQIDIYSKSDCHLCEVAKEIIELQRVEFTLHIQSINIEGNPDLLEKYKTEVPVVFINGKKAFKFKVETAELVEKLKIAKGMPA